jgi:hypothetical protein
MQRFTPTIEALVVPDIDSSLDEQGAKTRYWNAFKPIGEWWAALPGISLGFLLPNLDLLRDRLRRPAL